jgi:bacillithiol biosynthesis deacetylase BshB1
MAEQQTYASQALFIAPHPDDAEVFCGGTMALLCSHGAAVHLVDLTRGEMGSQGTPEIRSEEAKAAGATLGLRSRRNLGLPDAGISASDDPQIRAIVATIRELRPELLFIPYWEDRHPDHGAASELLTRALFFAGLKRYSPESGRAFQPRQLLFYQMRTAFRPSFVVDVTAVYETKRAAISAFSSQLIRETGNDDAPPTLVSSPLSQSSIEARDQYYGAMIGVRYAEPFLSRSALAIRDPLIHFRNNPVIETLILPGDS